MNYVPTKLKRSLVIDGVVSIHYHEYTVSFSYPGEKHDFWELIYCDKGELTIRADESEYRMRSGQAFLHTPFQYHNVKPANSRSASSVIISFTSDSDVLRRTAGSVIDTDLYTKQAIFSVLRESGGCFSNPPGNLYDERLIRKDTPDCFAGEQVIQDYIELLMIHLIRKQSGHDDFPRLPMDGEKNDFFNSISSYLEDNISEKLTVSGIAEEFSISPSTLKKLFRENSGIGTMEYVMKLRIQRAKEMLRDGKYSCTEIAAKCGFCSIHHFSKSFRSHTGMSPTEYVASVKAMLENPHKFDEV